MTDIKVEVDKDELVYGFCLICLQSVFSTNEEEINSINFLFNYLKIKDKVKQVVCEECEKIARKFQKLFNTLEKVSLEMDHLLSVIQSAILNSSKDFKPESFGVNSVRKSLIEKCRESQCGRQLQVILQKLDVSTLPRSQVLVSAYSSSNCDNKFDSSKLEENGAIPVVEQVIKLEDAPDISILNKKNSTSKTKTIFKCAQCSKVFNTKAKLKIHNDAVHLQLRPFNCDKCDKSFHTKPKLRKHDNTVHLRLKPFKCDLCDKSFATFSWLKIHKAVPHKPKPASPKVFTCEICAKVLNNCQALSTHRRRVHGENRFSCDICKKAFKTTDHLKRHVAAVHENQRHPCKAEGCEKNYSNQSSLNCHYKLEHPGFFTARKK